MPRRSRPRCVVVCLASGLSWSVATFGLAAHPAAGVRVYRFHDQQGIEHYVNRIDQVPAGTHAQAVDLGDVPLNPETASALEAAAERAAAARAQTDAQRATRQPRADSTALPDRALSAPRQTLPLALWAIGMTGLFVLLWMLRRLTRADAAGLSFALAILRLLAGSLAAVGWAATAYELRGSAGWVVEHVPPLRSLAHARQMTQAIDAQQRARDRELERAMKQEP